MMPQCVILIDILNNGRCDYSEKAICGTTCVYSLGTLGIEIGQSEENLRNLCIRTKVIWEALCLFSVNNVIMWLTPIRDTAIKRFDFDVRQITLGIFSIYQGIIDKCTQNDAYLNNFSASIL